MKQAIIISMATMVVIILGVSCRRERFFVRGEGPTVTNTRTVPNFDGVSLSLDADIEILYDSVCRLEISGQQNIINLITTDVANAVMEVDLKRHTTLGRHEQVTVKLFMPRLGSVDISGSGNVRSNGVDCESVSARISGSGDINFNGSIANSLDAHISGSGNMSFNSNSSCLNAKYSISGSGGINAEWLKADYVDAKISGSGDLKIDAEKQLDVKISGSGDVSYRGNAAVSASISGSGKLRRL